MKHRRQGHTIARLLLTAAGISLSGCTAGYRNLTNTIIVTTTPALTETETKIVLELRNAREEVSLNGVEGFLASDAAAKLGWGERSCLLQRCRALRLTLPQARREWAQECADDLAIVRPDPDKAFADGNVVVYVAGKSGVHVLFSYAEIGQLLAFRRCADDLATIEYAHPAFDSARLLALRDRIASLGLNVAGLSPSKPELERLKTEAATRVLERCLRDRDPSSPDDAPLLTSGTLSPTRSPRLTAALKDPSAIERILRDHDPNALRALLFLLNRNIIELKYP